MLNDIPESEDIYLIASFNHWLPIKMNSTGGIAYKVAQKSLMKTVDKQA
jgi:hypothetical protein